MKKIFLSLPVYIMIFNVANSQFTKVGGGASFGTGYHYNNETAGAFADMHRSPFIGIFLTGIYEFKLPVHIAPSFTYFIPRHNTAQVGTEETRVSSMMFDIDGHYVFNALDRFEFFALAGLNIHFSSLKWLGTDSGDKDNAFGFNIGAGSYIKLTEQIDLYGQAKYILSKYDQFMFNAGMLLNIDWMKKHENAGI
jgi:hypothetical protein